MHDLSHHSHPAVVCPGSARRSERPLHIMTNSTISDQRTGGSLNHEASMNRLSSRIAARSVALVARTLVIAAIASPLFSMSARAQDKDDDKFSKRAQRASEVLSE